MEQTSVGGNRDGSTEEPQTPVSVALRRVLIVGGGLAGLAAARELRSSFRVTVVDAKEYFEFTPSIMKAYAHPSHWDATTFLYKNVLERTFGVAFIWGEVTSIDGEAKCARMKPMFAHGLDEDVIPFDYCIICGGCNFNPLKKSGESCWFPTVHQKSIEESEFRHLDQRFLEGRRRRILEEHQELVYLNDKQEQSSVLVVGAGYIGVQWACELQQHFPKLSITICDFYPRCLISLPETAAEYCEAYMQSRGIRTVYKQKYDEKPSFLKQVGLPNGVDKTYINNGIKHSNYFMPPNTLSDRGPGNGGWILTNRHLQVMTRNNKEFGGGCIFAVGDCIYGCLDEDGPEIAKSEKEKKEKLQTFPRTSYTAETQALHACTNIEVFDRKLYESSVYLCCLPFPSAFGRQSFTSMSWPWGSSIWAISLGSNDGCIIVGGSYENNQKAGRILMSGQLAAAQKELIETTKMAQCKGDHLLGSLLWHLIHHWPINCAGLCITFPVP